MSGATERILGQGEWTRSSEVLLPMEAEELRSLLDASALTAGGSMARDPHIAEGLRARAAQLAEVAEADEEVEVEAGAAWAGPIVQEGLPTGDGREIKAGALKWRALPLTLMGQKTTPEWGGHAEAQVSGRIDTIERVKGSAGAENDLAATGLFDSGEWGQDIQRMIGEGTLKGVSVDLAVDEAEIVPDPDIEDPDEAYWMGSLLITDATILGATVVPFPAFENAVIAIVASGGKGIELVAGPDGKQRRVLRKFHTSVFFPFAATVTASAAPARANIDELLAALDEATDNLRVALEEAGQ